MMLSMASRFLDRRLMTYAGAYYYCVIKRREDSKDSGAEIERGG
jgi:hypothetical protein